MLPSNLCRLMAPNPTTPVNLAHHVPLPVSPAPIFSGARRPPAYLQGVQSSPHPVSSPPGSPLGPILGKRTSEDGKEGVRPSPYEVDLSSHPGSGLPPKYFNQVHIDRQGNWASSGADDKVPDSMPPPVTNIYYPLPQQYQTPGGPANTIGAPFRLDATDNIFAPPPSGIHEYTDEAIAKIRERIIADPELHKNLSGFDPAFMIKEGLLKQPPDSVSAMALAAEKWANMPNMHPKKVLKRKLDLNKFIPEPREKTAMYKDWMKLMMGLDGKKQIVQKGEGLSGNVDDSKRSQEEKQKREEERAEVIQHLNKAKDSYNNLVKNLYPGTPVASTPKFKGDPKELIDKVKLQQHISCEMGRLHDIRREINAIIHQHDIVWKDKTADDPIVRKNKFVMRMQLREQHKDAEGRYLKQKQIAYGWMEANLGSSAWLKKRQSQSKGKVPQDPMTQPVAMSKWRINPQTGEVEGSALAASQGYAVTEDSEMSEEYEDDYEQTSAVTWKILNKLYKVLTGAGVTMGVCAANGDNPALASLTYDPEQPHEPKRFVTLARAFEDLFEIMGVISTKVRKEESIARRDLDRPIEPELVEGSLLDLSEEMRYDSNSNSNSTSTGHSEIGDRDTPDDTIMTDYPETLSTQTTELWRPDTPKSVHFTPPKVPQNTPVKPYSVWRPVRDATPHRPSLRSQSRVSKSLSAVTVTPPPGTYRRHKSYTPASAPRLRAWEWLGVESTRPARSYLGLPKTEPSRARQSTPQPIYGPVSKLWLKPKRKHEPAKLEGSDGSQEVDEGQYEGSYSSEYSDFVGEERDSSRAEYEEEDGSEESDSEYTGDSEESLEEQTTSGSNGNTEDDNLDRLEDWIHGGESPYEKEIPHAEIEFG